MRPFCMTLDGIRDSATTTMFKCVDKQHRCCHAFPCNLRDQLENLQTGVVTVQAVVGSSRDQQIRVKDTPSRSNDPLPVGHLTADAGSG